MSKLNGFGHTRCQKVDKFDYVGELKVLLDSISKKNLGDYLKKRRLTLGITQKHIAQIMGYSTPQFISNWERGISSPPVDKLESVSNVYGIPNKKFKAFLRKEVNNTLDRAFRSSKD